MGKRANGEGTLKPRKRNGKTIGWKGAVIVGHLENGTPDRRWVSGKTQDDVREKMEALKGARDEGLVPPANGLTMKDYLARWLAHKEPEVKPKTLSGYKRVVEKRLGSALGRLKLEKLRPLDIERALRKIREGSGVKEARRARTVLSLALNQAVRWMMLPRNPCQVVKPPPLPHDEDDDVRFWTPEEAAAFLRRARGHRLYALFHLALLTGMRAGELLGLRWRDLDLEAGRLRVEQNAVDVDGRMELGTPKSKASRRTITLSPDTVAALEEHRERQRRERWALEEHRERQRHERWALEHPNASALRRRQEREGGPLAYLDQGLVFASELGTVTGYRSLRRAFKGLIRDAEVGDLHLHGLRHTHASVLIRRGVSPKVVSDRLGHTSVAFTLKTYAHLFDEQRLEAAIGLEDFLGLDARAPIPATPVPVASNRVAVA